MKLFKALAALFREIDEALEHARTGRRPARSRPQPAQGPKGN